ncbi:hypothetical protein [Antrihabitans spumae]|uniref:hypothetical protein n=1 Tax=Antrihabitans spumae TaxID=3373370 RepID=UPI003750117B
MLERERERALATLAVAIPTFEAGAKFDDILAALLRLEPAGAAGDLLVAGSTRPGFAVVLAEPERMLVLGAPPVFELLDDVSPQRGRRTNDSAGDDTRRLPGCGRARVPRGCHRQQVELTRHLRDVADQQSNADG